MLPTVILSTTIAGKKQVDGKDFFSRLEEDYEGNLASHWGSLTRRTRQCNGPSKTRQKLSYKATYRLPKSRKNKTPSESKNYQLFIRESTARHTKATIFSVHRRSVKNPCCNAITHGLENVSRRRETISILLCGKTSCLDFSQNLQQGRPLVHCTPQIEFC
jgi:hypothetical protein